MTDLLFALALLVSPDTAAGAQHAPHDDAAPGPASAARRAEVARRGGPVMGFDLDRSTHVFERSTAGGALSVVSKEATPDQVSLIRAHLQVQAAAFSRGDYGGPSAIHGEDMPGLRELTAGRGRVRATFQPIERGGRILFATDDPLLAGALHRWFDAQLSDHGAHAAHVMPGR